MSSTENIYAILAEVARRAGIKEKANLVLDDLIHPAKAIAASKSRRKAIQVSRRGGKSYSVCSIILSRALKIRSDHLYLALTNKNVRRIAWTTFILLLRKYDIKHTTNSVLGIITLFNGSTIEMAGADGDENIANRLLGAHFSTVVFDEAGSFDPLMLDYLIDQVIQPTLIDTRGDLYLIGSPQAIDKGKFYEACHGEHGYEYFNWLTSENQYTAVNYLQEIEDMKVINPEIIHNAWFKRNYLNQWAKDESDLVYVLNDFNVIDKLPDKDIVRYIGGLDFGFKDPCAWVVCALFKDEPVLYAIDEYSKSGMNHSSIAAKTLEFAKKYPGITFLADYSAALTLNEIQTVYACPVTAASKKGLKVERVENINNDLVLKKIFIYNCPALVKEMTELPKAKSTRRNQYSEDDWQEHSGYDNHLCDAFSYAFIDANHSFNKRDKIRVKTLEEQEMDYIRSVNKPRKGRYK